MIDIHLTETQVRLGHFISGFATWHTEKAPDRVSARVGWVTEGRGDRDDEYVGEESVELGSSEFAIPDRLDFSLQIPNDGPPSYDGKIVRIVWVVEVRVYLSWAKDIVTTERFRVVA